MDSNSNSQPQSSMHKDWSKWQLPDGISQSSSARLTGPCGLKFCRLSPCILKTHRAYVKARLSQVRSDDVHIDPPGSSPVAIDPRLLSLSRLTDLTAQHIDRNFADLFPALPFETPYVQQFRDLLHYYMSDHVHRVSRIFAPHLDPVLRSRGMLEILYSNPIFSVSILGNSQTDRVMLGRSSAADRTTMVIYGVVLRVLKERINSFRQEDIPSLLLLVAALTGLESCLNAKPEGLLAHRSAIQKLVTIAGGIDRVGHVQSYVMNIDRFIALPLGEYPLYGQPVSMSRPMRPLGQYGKAFEKLDKILDLQVIDFSEDQCRLIDLLEVGEVDLSAIDESSLTRSVGSDVLPHFLYLREKLSSDHAYLHAYYHESRASDLELASEGRTLGISRCVMLAGHIVFYLVAFADFYTTTRPMLGTELFHILQRKPRADWMAHKDIVIWLLFVLATIPMWNGHDWSVAELRLWLSMKYTEDWPDGDWIMHEASTVRSFVWSDRQYTKTFDQICQEVLDLEKGLRELQVTA